jgi:anti-sigma B factor antagonist
MRLETLRAEDSIHHVALVGRLDVKGVNEVQYEFQQQTTVLPKPTLVDLSKVTYIASLGLGMLVSAAKHLERRGFRMVLVSPTELVRKTIETSCLDRVIAIADDEAAALALLR